MLENIVSTGLYSGLQSKDLICNLMTIDFIIFEEIDCYEFYLF